MIRKKTYLSFHSVLQVGLTKIHIQKTMPNNFVVYIISVTTEHPHLNLKRF